MYHQAAQISGTARQNRPSDPRTGRPNRKKDMQRQEQIRLLQLLVCLALFLTVFIGKGVFPDKMVQVRDNILTLISTDLDVREAFSQLGSSLTEQGSVLSGLGEFCVEVFGSGRTDDAQQAGQQVPELADVLEQELAFLSGNPSAQLQSAHYLYAGDETVKPDLAQREVPQPEAVEETPQPVQEPAAIPAAGTVLVQSDYSGQPLPENYTMDQLSLGALDTVTPVVGHLNSTYGYRDHPINGKYQFHGGVDIGGQNGDPISAFAAGTVEYVGEDDSYRLYMQLDHGNGVKSFYAHCSTICVKKGESVTAGQKIAEVGSSGAATGPHLHLELKYNKLHLNPEYYITFLPQE